MKKVFIGFIFLLALSAMLSVSAKSSHGAGHHGPGCHHAAPHGHHYSRGHYRGYYNHSSGSTPVYIIKKEYSKSEQKFTNCSKHYAVVETMTYFYSDGTRRTYVNNTIYNSDGSVIIDNCQNIKHIIYKDNHYFVVRKGKICRLIDGEGNDISEKAYTSMDEVSPNRLLIRYNKQFGIIDLCGKSVVPAKYQKMIRVSRDVFVSKLNGYYGIIDVNNNVLVKNECEKIKPILDVLLLKKYGKYGLADTNGKIILKTEYDKIKKLG